VVAIEPQPKTAQWLKTNPNQTNPNQTKTNQTKPNQTNAQHNAFQYLDTMMFDMRGCWVSNGTDKIKHLA
jgi:hypothetical protein